MIAQGSLMILREPRLFEKIQITKTGNPLEKGFPKPTSVDC